MKAPCKNERITNKRGIGKLITKNTNDSTAKTRTLTTKHPFLNSEIVRKGANEVVEK